VTGVFLAGLGGRAWTGGEDTDHWRAQAEGLGAQVREAGTPQQILDFAGGAVGRVRRGPGAAGLGRDGNTPAGYEPSAQLGEPFGTRGPEPEGVDSENSVEGTVESDRKLLDRCIDQGDPAGSDGGGVAPGRLPEHHAGMVDAVHATCAGADQFRDRDAGAETNLKDTVGGLHTEQRDHPAVALPVGRAMGKHPASHASGRAPGMMALANDVAVQGAHDGYPGPPDHILNGGGHHPPHCPWHASLMLSSHDRQSTPSSAPEVNTPGGLLTIGELARRAGVTASALRYYEELGLLPPPARISGQRRYPESAARLVAAILLYSDAGFTLAEQKALMATRASTPGDRRQLMRRKLAELDEQIARAQAVREAISHGLRCPHEDITQCPNFNAGITARLAGQPLSRSHQQLHGNGSTR
jgi:DNA-binding transcriptional MerR regulator